MKFKAMSSLMGTMTVAGIGLTLFGAACGGGGTGGSSIGNGASVGNGASTASVAPGNGGSMGADTCVPDCGGMQCGVDPNCGQPCGVCSPGEQCQGGQCSCVPDCGGMQCGADPNCGASCGTCSAGDECQSGECVCVPDCGDQQCGLDPKCGTSCGTCPAGDECSAGQCACVPQCGGLQCGADPHCGASCGTCATGQTCNGGICVEETTNNLCWNVTDDCINGQEIAYKLYDRTKNWVWPGATLEWNIGGGQSFQNCITCTPGDQICFGGTESSNQLYWGVGLEDTYSCTACCFTCADATVTLPPLTCN